MKRNLSILLVIALMSCKNNGQNTTAQKPVEPVKSETTSMKTIIVNGEKANSVAEPDFSVLSWNANNDVLEVVVRYSGGCKTHDFNAYFSGAWLKSFPPKAIIALEHLNPDKDPCRSMVKDTLRFDLKNVRYDGGKEVIVQWSADAEKWAKYKYAE